MTWKHDLQLRDLDGGQAMEITCRQCGHTYYKQVSDLYELGKMSYLDEVEKRLFCKRRSCHGPVRIALMDRAETDGFVGGLP